MGNISVRVIRNGKTWACELRGPDDIITLFESDKQNAANGAHDLYEAVQNAINIDGESNSLKAVAEATRDGDKRIWGVMLYMGNAPMAALRSFGHKMMAANNAADFADKVNAVLAPMPADAIRVAADGGAVDREPLPSDVPQTPYGADEAEARQ